MCFPTFSIVHGGFPIPATFDSRHLGHPTPATRAVWAEVRERGESNSERFLRRSDIMDGHTMVIQCGAPPDIRSYHDISYTVILMLMVII